VKNRRIAAFVAGALVAVSTVMAGSSTAASAAPDGDVGIQSCYGDAFPYYKAAGDYDHPDNNYSKTTTSCADINIKVDTPSITYVRVCFYNRDTGYPSCQAAYTAVTAGRWTTIATNVKDNALYFFNFYYGTLSHGWYAA
jgi:hypothetical protein